METQHKIFVLKRACNGCKIKMINKSHKNKVILIDSITNSNNNLHLIIFQHLGKKKQKNLKYK